MGLLIHLLILPFKRPIIGLLIGLAILGGVFTHDWENEQPSCGGSTMEPGDVCHKLSDTDGSLDKSFDDVKAQDKQLPYIFGGLGGILVISGAVTWPLKRRREAAAREAAAAAAATAVPTTP